MAKAPRNEVFNETLGLRPSYSDFDLSYRSILTCRFGELVPILNEDAVPGDIFKVNTEIYARFAPLIAPIMQSISAYTHFFFVPYRLIWENWQKFCEAGFDNVDTPTFPMFVYNYDTQASIDDEAFHHGSLADYLNLVTLPETVETAADSQALIGSPSVSQFHYRAYQEIYNEYYRDENLSDKIDYWKGDGEAFGILISPDAASQNEYFNLLTSIRHRAWKKDYFTSALPYPEKAPDVIIPTAGGTSGRVDVTINDLSTWLASQQTSGAFTPGQPGWRRKTADGSQPGTPYTASIQQFNVSAPLTFGNAAYEDASIGDEFKDALYDPNGSLGVDLAAVSGGLSISDLRTAVAMQHWFEVSARGGQRYIEQIYAHFGVHSPDMRLQRPEYLGGGKTPVQVSEVFQTSESTENSPQGNYSGYGSVHSFGSHGMTGRFTEHGVVMGILSFIPTASYWEGIPRKFLKKDLLDFYWPEFANLGEQPILNKELLLTADAAYNEGIFGYTPRYAEYKFNNDQVHGDFRGNMAFWHQGRNFTNLLTGARPNTASRPALNQAFIEVNPSYLASSLDGNSPLNRIFAVTDFTNEPIWVELYHDFSGTRLMPRHARPGLSTL